MLSRKQLEAAKRCTVTSCVDCEIYKSRGKSCAETLSKTALELLDKTEAQEKEIDKLKCFTPKQGECIFDGEQVMQIMAQNAAMREALKKVKEAFYKIEQGKYFTRTFKIADEAMAEIDKVIGGGQSD